MLKRSGKARWLRDHVPPWDIFQWGGNGSRCYGACTASGALTSASFMKKLGMLLPVSIRLPGRRRRKRRVADPEGTQAEHE